MHQSGESSVFLVWSAFSDWDCVHDRTMLLPRSQPCSNHQHCPVSASRCVSQSFYYILHCISHLHLVQWDLGGLGVPQFLC